MSFEHAEFASPSDRRVARETDGRVYMPSKRSWAATSAAACAALATAFLLTPGQVADAQTKAPAKSRRAQIAPPQQPSAPPEAQIVIPDSDGITILIDNTILALSHANITGNYTVLRDLGAPDFQALNSPQKLSMIFAGLRNRNLNLNPVVLFRPSLTTQPAIDDKGFLRVAGFYATEPLQVHFDLAFEPVEGSWRLFEISVWTAAMR